MKVVHSSLLALSMVLRKGLLCLISSAFRKSRTVVGLGYLIYCVVIDSTVFNRRCVCKEAKV